MTRKRSDTKERILDTATNLFSSHGFSGTSIDDILSAVGITKGAFYHYFKGKEALCESVIDIAVSRYHELADSIQTQPADGQLLSQWLGLLLEKQSSGKWLYCRLLTRLSIESGELNAAMQNKLQTFWLWYQNLFETMIRRMGQSQPEKNIDPAASARLLMAAHFGALWLDRCAPAKEDLTSVCETLLGYIHRS